MKLKYMYIRMTAVLLLTTVACAGLRAGTAYRVFSPDKKLELVVTTGEMLQYRLNRAGKAVIGLSEIGLQPAGEKMWGRDDRVMGVTECTADETVIPVTGRYASIRDHYNALVLRFAGDYRVSFRVYNEGIAYRFEGLRPAADSVRMVSETACFRLADDPAVLFGETDVLTAWELSNVWYPSVSSIPAGKYGITPMVFDNRKRDLRVVIAESDVTDYPGMYLMKGENGLQGYWAAYPAKVEMGSWGNFVTVVKEREPWLATVAGNARLPWRIAIVAEDDRELLSNNMVYLLAKPCQVACTDWIKPGKATWEWWHCAILENAPFDSGHKNLSTQLYKYYIDFAAENKLEYLLIDAGWSNLFAPNELNPKVDVKEIIRYGKEKNVGVWLWMVASTLMHHPHVYLDSVSAWGAAGVKIDFFDRDDQQVMREYENLAAACAERKLMVDFHGCSKPTGLHRAYPNILTYEAVRGAECSKWDMSSDPAYHLQFIFGRMLAGPLDYTPGSMRNATREMFKPVDPGLPSTLGTRCHELAMYVVFDSQLTMLCDSPDEYRKYPDILRFLSAVPVSFDDTKVLAARIGRYAVVAKQKGTDWYVGGMCDWTPRELEVDFSFLPKGTVYRAVIYRDGLGSETDASRYVCEDRVVSSSTRLKLGMAPGGGFAMMLSPADSR